MAEITFGIEGQANIVGSGLGFFGATFGSSVQIGSYQDSTYVTNSDGTTQGPVDYNTKFTNPGSGTANGITTEDGIRYFNSSRRSLEINFDHTSEVNVQNVQLRIYDRDNINYPASGVNTKVCELLNFDSKTYSAWKSSNGDDSTNGKGGAAIGSGDLFWWGAGWNNTLVSQDYYDNSSGIRFFNFTDTDAVAGEGNGDSRLQNTVTGNTETVGGTGTIVPLFNSPGSGQRFLDNTYDSTFRPKWVQYYNNGSRPSGVPDYGSATTTGTYGGSGVDSRHTWRLGMSATPLSIGSKTQYGLYVSLEYL